MTDAQPLIPPHGGYRRLKSFQLSQLVYDLTAQFCDEHIDRRSRTHDQMVQAARSGVQNIAEGSQASGTSKKMELKLTNVARASLEELRLDYEDYLRQHGMEQWPPPHPALVRFKEQRCATLQEVHRWVEVELGREEQVQHGPAPNNHQHGRMRTDSNQPTGTDSGSHVGSPGSVNVGEGPCRAALTAQLEANAALSLLNLCCWLLDRQVAAQAAAFERDGGFTERLYSTRRSRRRDA